MASTGEVEEHEKNDALRRQTAPPPGARPGILAEQGPQRSDRSLPRSSGDALPYWLARRERQWTPPRTATSRLLRWRPEGGRIRELEEARVQWGEQAEEEEEYEEEEEAPSRWHGPRPSPSTQTFLFPLPHWCAHSSVWQAAWPCSTCWLRHRMWYGLLDSFFSWLLLVSLHSGLLEGAWTTDSGCGGLADFAFAEILGFRTRCSHLENLTFFVLLASDSIVRCLRLRSTGIFEFPCAVPLSVRTPTVTCSVPGSPEEYERLYVLGDGSRKMLRILYNTGFDSRHSPHVSLGGFEKFDTFFHVKGGPRILSRYLPGSRRASWVSFWEALHTGTGNIHGVMAPKN